MTLSGIVEDVEKAKEVKEARNMMLMAAKG